MPKPPARRNKVTSGASADSTSAANSAKEDICQQEDPGSATIDVTAVEVPELTEEEQRDRLHLERKVEKAFFEAGRALAELRDRRLYRSTHSTFEEYCKDRFGFERRHPYRLIEAAGVVDNLIPHSAGNLRQKIILVTRCTKELQNQFLSIRELNRRFNPIDKY